LEEKELEAEENKLDQNEEEKYEEYGTRRRGDKGRTDQYDNIEKASSYSAGESDKEGWIMRYEEE
jgi:hypothetical protein